MENVIFEKATELWLPKKKYDGLICGTKACIYTQNGIKGIIDPKGKEIAMPGYQLMYLQGDIDYIIGTKNDERHLLNYKGEVIADFSEYNNSYFLLDNYKVIISDNNLSGFINLSNGKVTLPTFDRVINQEGYQVVFAKKEKKYSLYNLDGELLNDQTFDSVKDFSPFYEDNAIVGNDGKYGVINTAGDLLLPCIYDKIQLDSFGFIWVTANDKIALLKTEK